MTSTRSHLRSTRDAARGIARMCRRPRRRRPLPHRRPRRRRRTCRASRRPLRGFLAASPSRGRNGDLGERGDAMDLPSLYLGAWRPLDGSANALPFRLPAHHLVTHGVITGMTGSGKTGLVTVMVEEALRAQVPVLVIDVKRDLPNLLLAFPSFAPSELVPWADASAPATDARSPEAIADELANERRRRRSACGIGEGE